MLCIQDLSVAYPSRRGPDLTAVNRLSLNTPKGQVLSLLGPSGCGKSTILKAIAGLLRPCAGDITFGQRALFSHARGIDLPASERQVGLLFQSYAIWPHMSVFDNAVFALTVGRHRPPLAQIRQRGMEVLERLRLNGLADRRATELSGGQQQRLALARTLVHEPELLLLDEPLSNLEPDLRASMTQELRNLQRETQLTMVLVTHDHTEAMALSDTIAVIKDGKLQQCASPRELYQRPENLFVAQFVGQMNLIPGVAWPDRPATSQKQTCCASPLGPLWLATDQAASPALSSWHRFVVGIRPESIHIHTEAPAGTHPNWYPTVIDRTVFMGERLEVHARINGHALVARCRPHLQLYDGMAVWFELPPPHCLCYPGPTS